MSDKSNWKRSVRRAHSREFTLPRLLRAIGRLVSADMTMRIVASLPPTCRRGSSGSQRGEPKAIA